MEKFSNFSKRLIASLITIVSVFILVFLSDNFLMSFFILLAVLVIADLAMNEFIQIVVRKNIVVTKKWMVISALLTIFSFFLISIYNTWNNLPVAVLVISTIVFFISSFDRINHAIARVSTSLLGVIYVAVPLGMIFSILYDTNYGKLWLFYLLIVVKISDVFAYFGGSLIGKHKLAEQLSPNKTWEGAITGIIGSALAGYGFYYLITYFGYVQMGLTLNTSIVLGIILGAVGQLSDLSESLLKRDAKVKDSSSLPGLGGILDILDSLLFTIPILYLYLK